MVLLGDRIDARCGAAADVVQQAGTLARPRTRVDAVRAGAHREDADQQVEGLADVVRADVGAEAPVAAGHATALDAHARDGLRGRQDQLRVGLVVAELHVVTRSVTLDQRPFQVEGLGLRGDDHPLDRACRGEHAPCARREGVVGAEVRREARAQGARLADVEDPTVRIEEEVTAGCVGDRPRFRAERERRIVHLLRAYRAGPAQGCAPGPRPAPPPPRPPTVPAGPGHLRSCTPRPRDQDPR